LTFNTKCVILTIAHQFTIKDVMKKLFGYLGALVLGTSLVGINPTIAQAGVPNDQAMKEFQACNVITTRPPDSIFIYKNKPLVITDGESNGYTADIYKTNKPSKNPRFVGYWYNVKYKGKIVANFTMQYKRATPGYASVNSLWNTEFSGCGPRPVDQNYPVIKYLFYDTVIGIKLEGYRSPKELGQVQTPNPIGMFGAVKQTDAPDFGN
jgi:hypothetical protein